mmetsp:Transcript_5313/g.16237  ORF Transcript_5313/g.16237 Transcript_5313/m.16237 type:complete len:211 (+) Transcript_5313:563-1195(+)
MCGDSAVAKGRACARAAGVGAVVGRECADALARARVGVRVGARVVGARTRVVGARVGAGVEMRRVPSCRLCKLLAGIQSFSELGFLLFLRFLLPQIVLFFLFFFLLLLVIVLRFEAELTVEMRLVLFLKDQHGVCITQGHALHPQRIAPGDQQAISVVQCDGVLLGGTRNRRRSSAGSGVRSTRSGGGGGGGGRVARRSVAGIQCSGWRW